MPKFKSKLEKDFFQRFKNDVKYESEKLSYTLSHTYTPDWTVAYKVFLETKGLWTSEDRSKIKAVLKQHPGTIVAMVFQRPSQKLSKSSKTSYADYCDKNGIIWFHANDTDAIRAFIAEYQDTD